MGRERSVSDNFFFMCDGIACRPFGMVIKLFIGGDFLKSNSNKCANVKKIHNEEIHKYLIGGTKFYVRVINKNENIGPVMERLKSVVINHADTEN